jgi:hypothetical protein
MIKYNRYSIALTEEENQKFLIIKQNGIGIKKVFMKGIEVLIRDKVLDNVNNEEEI